MPKGKPRNKTTKAKSKHAFEIVGGSIILTASKAPITTPAVRRPSKPIRVEMSGPHPSGPSRRFSARTQIRTVLNGPSEQPQPQSPKAVSSVSKKLRKHAPVPQRLPGVRPACNVCQHPHNSLADAMACLAHQMQDRMAQLAEPQQSALVAPEPQRRPSSVLDMVRYYNEMSRVGSFWAQTNDGRSAVLAPEHAQDDAMPLPMPQQFAASSQDSEDGGVRLPASSYMPSQQIQQPAVDSQPNVASSTPSPIITRPVEERQKATKTKPVQVSQPLKARPASQVPAASQQSGRYYRFPTLTAEKQTVFASPGYGAPVSSVQSFPRLQSNGYSAHPPSTMVSGMGYAPATSSIEAFPVLRPHVARQPIQGQYIPTSSGNGSFTNHEWAHLEDFPFLLSNNGEPIQAQGQPIPIQSNNNRSSFATYQWAHANQGIYNVRPQVDSTPRLWPAGLSFNPCPTEEMPPAHVIAEYAENYLDKVKDRVRDWIHRTSVSEGPELWHEQPLQESPMVPQPPRSVMQWVMGAMFGSPTPATPAPVQPQPYQPSQRWNNNDRIMFGSDASERPLPVPAQYAARAAAQQPQPPQPTKLQRYYQRNPIQVGLNFGPVSSTYMKPRAAPAPPQNQKLGLRIPVPSSNYNSPNSRFSTNSSAIPTALSSPFSPGSVHRNMGTPQFEYIEAQPRFSAVSYTPRTASTADDWLKPGTPGTPDSPHSGNTVPMSRGSERSARVADPYKPAPQQAPRKQLPIPATRDSAAGMPWQFADSSAASVASMDTVDHMVEDLAGEVDAQLGAGRELGDIVREWEALAAEVGDRTALGPQFEAVLQALREQLAEEEEEKAEDVWMPNEGMEAIVKTTWGIRTEARNRRRVAKQELEEEMLGRMRK